MAGILGLTWLDQRDIKREGACVGGREVHGWNLIGDTHKPGMHRISVTQQGFVPHIPRQSYIHTSRQFDFQAQVQWWDDGQMVSEPVEDFGEGEWEKLEDREAFVDLNLFVRMGHFQGGSYRSKDSIPVPSGFEVCYEGEKDVIAGVGKVYIRKSKEG